MTNDERSPNEEMPETPQQEIHAESAPDPVRALEFDIPSSLGVSSFVIDQPRPFLKRCCPISTVFFHCSHYALLAIRHRLQQSSQGFVLKFHHVDVGLKRSGCFDQFQHLGDGPAPGGFQISLPDLCFIMRRNRGSIELVHAIPDFHEILR